MMMSIEETLFWLSVIITTGLAYYVVRQYLKVVEYEKQVDRGWKDLIDRADKIVTELKEIRSQSTTKRKKQRD